MVNNHVQFWNEFLKRDVSFLSEEIEGTKQNSFFSQLFETSREFIEPFRGGNVLEIGCGDGIDSIALALNYGCNVTAIDISPRRVELAQSHIKKFGVEKLVSARVGDATSLDFKDGEFDGVLGNSIMLFLDHEKACKEVARVLKTGGRFVLTNESMASSTLVELSRKFGLGYRSKNLEEHVNSRLSPYSIKKLGTKYFAGVFYVSHFGLLMQTVWGGRLVFDRVMRIFRNVETYHKPDVFCPPILKQIDRYLIEKWDWYHNRAWIAAIRFIK